MKVDLKKQAQALRRQGFLFSEIATKLAISRSTAQVWTANLTLTPLEQRHLAQRKLINQQAKMTHLAARKHLLYVQREQRLLDTAREIVHHITPTVDSTSLLCAILYWCEGTKDVSSGIKFTNADPVMIRGFLSLLRSSFEVDESKFRALVHLHEYHDPKKQLVYWSQITNIPLEQFHKTYIKPHTSKNKHADYPGCVSIRYLDASLGKLLKMIYSEYGQTL